MLAGATWSLPMRTRESAVQQVDEKTISVESIQVPPRGSEAVATGATWPLASSRTMS